MLNILWWDQYCAITCPMTTYELVILRRGVPWDFHGAIACFNDNLRHSMWCCNALPVINDDWFGSPSIAMWCMHGRFQLWEMLGWHWSMDSPPPVHGHRSHLHGTKESPGGYDQKPLFSKRWKKGRKGKGTHYMSKIKR
jgi:hypothetical protein